MSMAMRRQLGIAPAKSPSKASSAASEEGPSCPYMPFRAFCKCRY